MKEGETLKWGGQARREGEKRWSKPKDRKGVAPG